MKLFNISKPPAVRKPIDRKGAPACAAFLAAGILIGLLLGTLSAREPNPEQTAQQREYLEFRMQLTDRMIEAYRDARLEALREAADREARCRTEETIADENLGPALTAQQQEILTALSALLDSRQLEDAARLMLEQGDLLAELYYNVMESGKYLYRDGSLYRELDGSGLVLAKSSLIFFGDFADGKPNGDCIGLQAIQLDYPRYDFALGSWKDGKLNGHGRIGYCCYEGAGDENRELTREGTFADNGMNGDVVLTTVNSEGSESSWTMTAENGTLVLDDRWRFDEESQSYQLISDQSDGHAYVVSGDPAQDAGFRNLLIWE